MAAASAPTWPEPRPQLVTDPMVRCRTWRRRSAPASCDTPPAGRRRHCAASSASPLCSARTRADRNTSCHGHAVSTSVGDTGFREASSRRCPGIPVVCRACGRVIEVGWGLVLRAGGSGARLARCNRPSSPSRRSAPKPSRERPPHLALPRLTANMCQACRGEASPAVLTKPVSHSSTTPQTSIRLGSSNHAMPR